MTIRTFVTALALGALLAGPALAAPAAAWKAADFPGDATIEDLILALTNAERAKEGRTALVPDERLRAAARQHSAEMEEKRYFAHESPVAAHAKLSQRVDLTGFAWRGIAENIFQAEGYDTGDKPAIAKLAVESWMDSPGHRRNILSPDLARLGVGVTVKGDRFQATQVFGTPR